MKNKNKINHKNGRGKRLLNAAKLFTVMGIATALSTPKNSFSQINNGNKIENLNIDNDLDISDYQKLIKERDEYIKNNWNSEAMDPNKYFVLNQRAMFLKDIKLNEYGEKNKLNTIGNILKNKFNIKLSGESINTVKMALKVISTEANHANFSILTDQLTNEFDVKLIDAYGYIQTNMPGVVTGYYGNSLPIIELNYTVLDRIVELLEKGTYNAKFKEEITKPNIKPEDKKDKVVSDDKTNGGNSLDDLLGAEPVDNKIAKDIVPEKEIKETEVEDKKEVTKPNIKPEDKKDKVISNDKTNGGNSLDDLLGAEPVDNKIAKDIVPEKEIKETETEDKKEVIEPMVKPEDKKGKVGSDDKNNGDGLDDLLGTDPIEDEIVKDIVPEKEIKETEIKDKKEVIKPIVEPENNNDNIASDDENIKSLPETEQDMSVPYKFKEKLNFELGSYNLLIEINYLINTYPIIKNFVEKLKDIDVNFNEGDKTSINQTALVLEFVNGDYDSGYRALNDVIAKGQTKSVAILTMLKTLRHDYNTEDFQTLQIINNMLWDANMLSKKLDKNKLNNISYQEIIDVVNTFKSPELQKAFMYQLLNNDVEYAQELMGMDISCSDYYPAYKAKETIGKEEIKKIMKLGKTRKYMQQDEIIKNKKIPQDVKDRYLDFVSGKLDNKGFSYNILSKTDMKLYMFSNKNILLARQNMIIGMQTGDQKNIIKVSKTTPGGMYRIGIKFEKDTHGKNLIDKDYGTHYIMLEPLNGQYDMSSNSTLGIHGTWLDQKKERELALKSKGTNDNRMSGGCPNAMIDTFGELYNQLDELSRLYITFEPTSQEIQNFKNQIK